MSESRKAKEEYETSEQARIDKLSEEAFSFDELKEYAIRHDTFMEQIHEGIEFYCKKMKIINPTNGGFYNAWDDSEHLEITGNGILIKYADDIGTCGETDIEEKSLFIPIKYCDTENRETEAEAEAQAKEDELKRLNDKLKEDKANHTRAYNKCRDIQSDQHKLKDLNRIHGMNNDTSILDIKLEEARKEASRLATIQSQTDANIKKLK